MFKTYSKSTGVKVLEKKMPEVWITQKASNKMKSYVDLCDDEIGWLCTAVEQNKNQYIITDAILFEQEVHSTTTEITPEGLAKFAEEILQQDGGVELWNSIKVWGHSHVNMTPTPSGQDNSQMEIFADNKQDWFIRIIANKKGEMKLDLYDFDYGVIYENVPFQIAYNDDEAEIYNKIQEIKAEIEEKLKGLQTELERLVEKNQDDIEKEVTEEIAKKVVKKETKKLGTIGYSEYLRDNKTYYSYGNGNYGSTVLKKISVEQDVYDCFTDYELISFSMAKNYLEFEKEFVEAYGKRYTSQEMVTIYRVANKYEGKWGD